MGPALRCAALGTRRPPSYALGANLFFKATSKAQKKGGPPCTRAGKESGRIIGFYALRLRLVV